MDDWPPVLLELTLLHCPALTAQQLMAAAQWYGERLTFLRDQRQHRRRHHEV